MHVRRKKRETKMIIDTGLKKILQIGKSSACSNEDPMQPKINK